MTDLDDFLPEINPKAPGCPAPTAYLAILQAADELCTKLRLWRHSEEIVVNSLDELDFTPPDCSRLVDFESVFFGDVKLEPKTVAWMDQCMRGWRRGSITGMPRFYTQLTPDTLRIAPIENGIVTVNCWLKPSMDADQVPDFLFTQYHEAIAWGALARILVTPDQPFTNVDMGLAYGALFAQKIASGGWKEIMGQQRAPVRSRGQFM